MFCVSGVCFCFCFFKQKTAYEVRISDWSSDVCSSDLGPEGRQGKEVAISEPNGIAFGHCALGRLLHLRNGERIELVDGDHLRCLVRSEERRVGKECVSTC